MTLFNQIVCATVVASVTASVNATERRVDVNVSGGTGDGGTWANAYKDLQDAIDASSDGDEIWVADGSYYPDLGVLETNDARGSTFSLKTGVVMAGGFIGGDPGGETEFGERRPGSNAAVLSGDLKQDDDNVGDNAYTVVTSTNNGVDTFIDGFTVRDGNKDNGASGDNGGAGMFIDVSFGPRVIRCLFRDNEASRGSGDRDGGAVWVGDLVSPAGSIETRFINCEFEANTTDGSGGGLATSGTTVIPIVFNCLFFENHADTHGGAAWNRAHFVNCTIVDNTADGDGGGLYKGFTGGSVTNCIAWDNDDDGNSSTNGEDENIGGSWAPSSVEYTTVRGCGFDENESPPDICSDSASMNDGDDPKFVSSSDYRLQSTSPAVDNGDLDALIDDDALPFPEFQDVLDINDDGIFIDLTVDLAGLPRVANVLVGRGAYERAGACAGDTDGDSDVDFDDILQVLGDWGDCVGCDGDLNDDDVVDFNDLLLVLSTWGNCGSGAQPDSLEDTLDCLEIDWDCWQDMFYDIRYGASAVQDDAICWLEHYESCHCPDTCLGGPTGCGSDPCGNH